IVLYPQASNGSGNPLGCWDWWGYDDARYAKKNGNQMQAVKAMVDRIASGAVSLNAPTGLSVVATNDTSISLVWNAVSGAGGYNIYRNGGKVNSSATTTFVDSGLASGTEYRYIVKATGSSGAEGKPSSEIVGTTTGPAPAVAPPTNLQAGAVTDTTVALSWSAATG